MELGRFLVEAVVVSGASPNQLARSHPISRSWLFRLLARYKQGGLGAVPVARNQHEAGSELRQVLRCELSNSRGGAGDDDDFAVHGNLPGVIAAFTLSVASDVMASEQGR